MPSAKQAAFVRLLLEICELYRIKLSEPLCALYWRDLHPFGTDALKQAWQKHRLEPERGRFAPKPADFLRYLKQHQGFTAKRAWYDLLQVIQNTAANQRCAIDNALTLQVVREIGGSTFLSQLPQRALLQQERYFIERYQQLSQEQSPRLEGTIPQVTYQPT